MSIFSVFRLLKIFILSLCLFKAIYIGCKNLKFVGGNVKRVCVVHFYVYVSRESTVESLCHVRLCFSFLVSCLYICEYNVSMSICFPDNFR